MKHVPVFIQHDISDCGATCLQMISSFYGASYQLSALRELTSITKEGVSILGLSEAAEKIGFRTIAVKTDFEKLQKAPLPCIVHWNQQHFVVITKFRHKKGEVIVEVNDPAVGMVSYSSVEFSQGWIGAIEEGKKKGIALLINTTPTFPIDNERQSPKWTMSSISKYLKPYKNFVVQILLGLIYGCLIQLLFPLLTQMIVDKGIGSRNIPFIYLILIAQLVLVFSSAAVDFIQKWIILHLSTRINISLITDFLIKLMKLPLGFFDKKTLGDLLRRIDDQGRIRSFIMTSGISILLALFSLILFGIIIFIYNRLIFSVFFVGSFIYCLWIRMFMKRREELDHKKFAQDIRNQNNTVQLLSSMQEIRLCGCERQKRWEWEDIQAKKFKLDTIGLSLAQYQESGAIFINQVKNIIITALAAKMVVDGHLTLGMMMSIQYIIGQLNGPVDQLIGFLRDYQDARISFERLQDINNLNDEEPIDNTYITSIPKCQDLELQQVSFAYDTTSAGKKVIDNFTLTIPHGKQTAIVGISGSGKTTLIKLLLGFYQPSSGHLLLGKVDLSNYSMKEWRQHCGIVMQDGFIFSDSIAKNIAPGDDDINIERLCYAAEQANINTFIESLPLKYNTKIGADGHGLSQGQKQRILIARAIYKNPEFVLLDEATNSLDANNEKVIMDNLQSFLRGRTSIVVAHRLSTVRNADQIVVIENGNIKEYNVPLSLDRGKSFLSQSCV